MTLVEYTALITTLGHTHPVVHLIQASVDHMGIKLSSISTDEVIKLIKVCNEAQDVKEPKNEHSRLH